MPTATQSLDPLSAVHTEISPDDTMLEGNREHYFSVGRSALDCIREGMRAAGREDFGSILDFGSGYGRVLRVLRATFPKAELAACDISPGAVEFCAKTFGAAPFLSSEDAAAIRIDRQFDLVWCGTLLTGFHAAQFLRFVDLLAHLVTPGGLLVFTTHGSFVAERLRRREFHYGLEEALIPAMLEEYDTTGYGYSDYPRAVLDRIGLHKYGIQISTSGWVRHQIEQRPALRFLKYSEQAWDNHQDSVACIRQ
jgi:SAM-dependent methyltransferase